MDNIVIRNIASVVTCDDEDRVYSDCDILVENGKIRRIAPNIPVPDGCEVLCGTHMLCYPGLINTHHHLYQYFSRNLPEVQGMELFEWLTALYEIWKKLDRDAVRRSAECGMGELMKNGCTTCFDHHYVFPGKASHLFIDEQFAAAEELGIRFHASRGSMDLSRKDGGLPPDPVVETVDEIIADSERVVAEYHDPRPGSMRQVALAPCSPFSVSTQLLRESAELARSLGVRLHTHLAETRDEENYTLAHFGMRPFDYMESLGWTGPDVWFAHGIHFNDSEIARLAKSGTGVAHCPISNMKLSSGTARIPDMLSAGVKVGLAVDGSASNDASNLLEEIRTGYLLHRLVWGERAPSGYDMLKMATRGGAAVLGRDDIGSIAPGKCADMFMVDSRRLSLTGACFDPKDLPGTVGIAGGVDFTLVGGRVAVRHGQLTGVDEEKLRRSAGDVCRAYLGR